MRQIVQRSQAIELTSFDERIIGRGDFHPLLTAEEQRILTANSYWSYLALGFGIVYHNDRHAGS